jgi:hypothetical protein
MTEPDFITSQDILNEFGQETRDRMLDFGQPHTDEGQPYWPRSVAADLLELIGIEDEIEEQEDVYE